MLIYLIRSYGNNYKKYTLLSWIIAATISIFLFGQKCFTSNKQYLLNCSTTVFY